MLAEIRQKYANGDWFKWNDLRLIGQLRLVQLTILVPIVGHLILFNDSVVELLSFENIFDGSVVAGKNTGKTAVSWLLKTNLYCLYFGLICVGIASTMYYVGCPVEIKQYSNCEKFADSELKNLTLATMRKWLALYGNIVLHITEHEYEYYSKEALSALNRKYQRYNEKIAEEIEKHRVDECGEETQYRPLDKGELNLLSQPMREILTTHYEAVSYKLVRLRRLIGGIYIVGFVVLGIPSVIVFFRVLYSIVKSIFI